MKTYTTTVEEVPGDDELLQISLPDEVVEMIGAKIGDTLSWEVNEDGTILLSRSESNDVESTGAVFLNEELVLVETIQSFRLRYLIAVPKGKKDWALDDVVTHEGELEELSQQSLMEQTLSHRVVTEEEAREIFETDNCFEPGACNKLPINRFL